MTTQHPEPARLPLWVRAHGVAVQEGQAQPYKGWIVVTPDDDGYEVVYQEAAAALRLDGAPMPYADAEPPDVGTDEAMPPP